MMVEISLLLVSAWMLPTIAFSARMHQSANYSHNISRVPVMNTGDAWECDGISLTLDAKLGRGNWGEVWSSADKKYAVKVEVQKRLQDKFGYFKDLKHECGIMRDLQKVQGINVPQCHGFCERDESQIIVMDLLQNAVDMRTVTQHHSNFDMYQVARQLYSGVAAMLAAGIINVDQSATNILVGPNSKVYFIDMGMAERKVEALEMYSDSTYARSYSVLKKFSYFGKDAGIPFQLGLVSSNTASSVLSALPTRSPEAMKGLADAFCEDGHSELVAKLYTEVMSNPRDKRLFQALTGKDFMGDVVCEPQFATRGGRLVKVGDLPVTVTNHYDRKEEHIISAGAELYGLKCEGDYGVEVEDLADFSPRYIRDLCKGWYYFADDVPYIAAHVKSILRSGGYPDFTCK